ncbi:MAG: type II secretion system F family protein, partial [Kiritimatiellae bacterium]|nr:type II secretion system F family protein [Kiritimatiellia bacterium]
MRTYSYRGYTDSGKSCKGLIEAFHEKEAGEKLAERNIYATRLEEVGHHAKRSFFFGGKRRTVSPDARALLYRELAVLLRAGLTLTQALELLIDTPELLASHSLLAGIRDAIRQGSSLAAAQEQAGLTDQPLEHALIEMGERAGALGDVLMLLADYLDERGRLRDRIQTALIYPSLVLMMSVVIMIFMFGFMMPRFAKLFDEARLVLPLFTRVVLAGGRFAGVFLSAFLLLSGLGFVLWRGWFSRREEAVFRLERVLFSLPGVGVCFAAVVNVRL